LKTILYIALCIAVPPLWGLLSYWLFELIGLRRRRAAATDEPPSGEGGDPEPGDAC
jgi:hypothetical protein